jgi:hypothetical protein
MGRKEAEEGERLSLIKKPVLRRQVTTAMDRTAIVADSRGGDYHGARKANP